MLFRRRFCLNPHRQIWRILERLMTDVTKLVADVADLKAGAVLASAALDDLAAKVAALSAGNVTQEQIDAIDADVVAVKDALAASVAKDDPPAPPAA